MTETRGRPYPVDGESFAHGQAVDVTYTYDREDIMEGLIEYIETSYELDIRDTFKLNGNDVEVGDYLSTVELDRLEYLMEVELLDDDYGTEKHKLLIEEYVDEVLDEDAEAIFETTEMR